MTAKALILVENLSVPSDRRVWQECVALRDHGWDVEVICPCGEDRDCEPEVVIDDVRIHRYPLQTATGGPASFLREYGQALVRTLRLTLAVARRGRVDVVHLCNPPDMLFLVALVLRARGTRVVFDQHDLVPELYLSRFRPRRDALYWAMRLTEFLTYRTADVVLSTNESYRDIAVRRGHVRPERAFTVRSAPAGDQFHEVPAEPALRKGKKHLLCYVGVMGPQDGVDYAVRALAHLRRQQRDDWHAVFLGAGDALDGVRRLAEDLGLSDCVTFAGWTQTPDLLRYLSTADIGLAPDPYNPLNDLSTMNKIVEYMAMGVPVVSFDLRESRFSAQDAAVYATDDSVEQFAALVSELLDDPERRQRMGEIGRDRLAGPLSWKHSEQALLAAYDVALQVATRR